MTPTDDEERAKNVLGDCSCHVAYKGRQLTAPDCVWCNYGDEVMSALRLSRAEGRLEGARELTFRRLQDEQRPWVAHNFDGRHDYYPLLGAMEELGELAHAHLKGLQGIRHTPEEIAAKKRDAVADVVIFLSDYCSASGIDFQQAVEETWAEVRKRDWKADPKSAGSLPLPGEKGGDRG